VGDVPISYPARIAQLAEQRSGEPALVRAQGR
jgi:hypothetical protein